MIGFDCIRTYIHGIDVHVLLNSACFLQLFVAVVLLVPVIGRQYNHTTFFVFLGQLAFVCITGLFLCTMFPSVLVHSTNICLPGG